MLVREYYNERYAKDNQNKPRKTVIRFVNKYLKKGDTCLDLGCGEGRNAKYMWDRGIKVYGIDISDEGVRQTNKRIGVDVASTAKIIDLKSGSFKCVVCNRVIEYGNTNQVFNTICEISRLLHASGIALITTRSTKQPPNDGEVLIKENQFGGRDYQDTEYEDNVQHYFSETEIQAMVDAARLKIVKLKHRITKGTKCEWILVVRKI